jgi:AraC family transcriptional regulator
MTQLSVQRLLSTPTATIFDVVCAGQCRHKSAEECAQTTHLVFPYRGVYVRHAGSDTVAEPNQVLFFNGGESYRISHPVVGGDACLSLALGEDWLREIAPAEHVRGGQEVTFRPPRLRIDSRTQALVALLRYSLIDNGAEPLEAESLTLSLVRHALKHELSYAPRSVAARQKIVDRVKVLLSSDVARRWTLAEIAAKVGGSPVYLTQLFQKFEGIPLYRYQMRLRLARSLQMLGEYDDLARLGLDLGFSSHSHFSAAFKQAFGRSPAQFQRSARLR